MDAGKAKIIQLLVEAHSNELGLINVLSVHSRVAERGSYKSLIERHLRETRDHADRIQKRIDELGHSRNPLTIGYGAMQNLIKQGLVLTKGPVDVIRGRRDVNEKMLRNAIDESMTEGLEIASYDAIEALARNVGDQETAELAASIRLDEEQMLDALRKEIPLLAEKVVRSQVPTADRVGEPWPGYDDMTAAEIESNLSDASDSLVLAVRKYELKNKNRKTVIDATERESVSG